MRFAIELIPVYEELTGRQATYNNWVGANVGLWAEFYEPLVTLVWQVNDFRTRAVLTLARTAIKGAIR